MKSKIRHINANLYLRVMNLVFIIDYKTGRHDIAYVVLASSRLSSALNSLVATNYLFIYLFLHIYIISLICVIVYVNRHNLDILC